VEGKAGRLTGWMQALALWYSCRTGWHWIQPGVRRRMPIQPTILRLVCGDQLNVSWF
jgi:hypothetical protein